MIKVESEVTVVEFDGKECVSIPTPTIKVQSHWNRDSLVVLRVGDHHLAVSARDLQAAVANATNTSRF